MPDITLDSLLRELMMRGGSDLHLLHGHPPMQRIASEIIAMGMSSVDSTAIWSMVTPFLNEHYQKVFQQESRVNISFTINGIGRFRMNICRAQGTFSASIRAIPSKIYP